MDVDLQAPDGWTLDVRNPVGEVSRIYLLPGWEEGEPQQYGFEVYPNEIGGVSITGHDLLSGAFDEETRSLEFRTHTVHYDALGGSGFETEGGREWFEGIPDAISSVVTAWATDFMLKIHR